MLSLISFIVVMVGAINWFCIGLLQFDFVAGLFGSQSSIFSRIVYIVVGIGALVLLFNLIENKGKIKFNFKKKENNASKEYNHTYFAEPKYSNSVEAGKDASIDTKKNEQNENHYSNGNCEIKSNDESQQNNYQNNSSNN